MKDLITIIIPCKNEKDVVQKTLDLLNYQSGINGVNVIISDSSNDEETVNKLLNRVGDKFNLKVNYAIVGNTVTMNFELTTDFLILPVSEFEKWAEFARVKKEVFSESLVLQKIN
jgi:glycosyltransferase involved in cell wall biosynthesis